MTFSKEELEKFADLVFTQHIKPLMQRISELEKEVETYKNAAKGFAAQLDARDRENGGVIS